MLLPDPHDARAVGEKHFTQKCEIYFPTFIILWTNLWSPEVFQQSELSIWENQTPFQGMYREMYYPWSCIYLLDIIGSLMFQHILSNFWESDNNSLVMGHKQTVTFKLARHFNRLIHTSLCYQESVLRKVCTRLSYTLWCSTTIQLVVNINSLNRRDAGSSMLNFSPLTHNEACVKQYRKLKWCDLTVELLLQELQVNSVC